MTHDADTVAKALKKKGFEAYEGDHQRFRYVRTNGKVTSINTKISHGVKEIDKRLFSAMSRQVKLSKEQFCRYVECTISRAAYEKILIDGKVLGEEVPDGNELRT